MGRKSASHSKTTNNKTSRIGRRRRTNRKGIMHVLRGLVMEGMGVAVLIFLYLTVQSSAGNPTSPPQQVHAETTQAPVHFTGHYANSWDEYTRKRDQQIGQQSQQGRLSSTGSNSF